MIDKHNQVSPKLLTVKRENDYPAYRFPWVRVFGGLLIAVILLIIIGAWWGKTRQPDGVAQQVRIVLGREGVYRIPSSDLRNAGMDVGIPAAKKLHLTLRGNPQTLYIVENGDSYELEFFARPAESLYTSSNVYILELRNTDSETTQIIDDNVMEPENLEFDPGATYQAASRFEENRLYFPQIDALDHWFWISVAKGQSQALMFDLSNVAPGSGHVQIGVWGATESGENPDHHVRALINAVLVIDDYWDGKGSQVFEAEIPDGALQEGRNRLFIEAPGDTSAPAEINWINWFEITHSRYPMADAGIMTYSADNQVLPLQGFAGGVHVYDITAGQHALLVYRSGASGPTLGYRGEPGRKYYLVDQSGFLFPEMIAPLVIVPDLKVSTNRYEYIAIGDGSLLEPLDDLLALRQEQGLSVLAVPVQAIYDQFGYGFPEPEAIKEFLRYAHRSWELPPGYVLLVGDATYDPKNYLGYGENYFIPSFFVQTFFGGQTVSDITYTQIDEDLLPDIAIGRIPASNQDDVEIFVRKTMIYERELVEGSEVPNILAIADGQDSLFYYDAESFLAGFDARYRTELYAPQAGVQDGAEVVVDYFLDGYSVVAYFGHGSMLLWGKDQLFTIEIADHLTNTQYPLIINMTCLTGMFAHPEIVSIAEALLLNPNGGGVAVLAPSSLTLPTDQSFISDELAVQINAGTSKRLGDVFVAAQRTIPWESEGIGDVLETFHLLGDPGLMLHTENP